jgi:hypothetical protein
MAYDPRTVQLILLYHFWVNKQFAALAGVRRTIEPKTVQYAIVNRFWVNSLCGSRKARDLWARKPSGRAAQEVGLSAVSRVDIAQNSATPFVKSRWC